MTNKPSMDLYFKEIKSLLLCPKSEKEMLLQGLRGDVEDFLGEHPNATMEDIKKRFGTPEEFANSYQSTMSETEIRKKVRDKRMLAYIIGGTVAVVGLAVFIGFVVYLGKLMADVPEYYIVEETLVDSVPSEVWETIMNDPNTVVA